MNKALSRGRLWPTVIIAAVTVFIAVNLAFVTLAFRNRPQLVSPDYYAQGFNLREIARSKAAGAATGWRVSVRHLPPSQADMPLIEINVTESVGTPCDSLGGEVAFYRPSEAALDIAEVPLRFVGAGRYLAFPPRPLEHGAWQAVVHLTKGAQELDQRISLFVEH